MEEKKQNIKHAMAVSYGAGEAQTPKITASGKAAAAEKIIEQAIAAGVPVHENAELLRQLSRLDFTENLPEEIYPAAMEIVLYLNEMNNLAEAKNINRILK